MQIKEIQDRLDQLATSMLAKGLREPSATFRLESQASTYIYLKWKDVTKTESRYANDEYKHFSATTIEAQFQEAEAFIAELPMLEEARFRQFMGALGNVIDLGKSNGIEVEFLNPLTATMKKLSDNILTYQPVAAE